MTFEIKSLFQQKKEESQKMKTNNKKKTLPIYYRQWELERGKGISAQ